MEETMDKDNDLEYVFGKNAGDDEDEDDEEDDVDTPKTQNTAKSGGDRPALKQTPKTASKAGPRGGNKAEQLGKRRPTKMLEIEEDAEPQQALTVAERGFRN